MLIHIKLKTANPAVAIISNIIISNFSAPKRSANLKNGKAVDIYTIKTKYKLAQIDRVNMSFPTQFKNKEQLHVVDVASKTSRNVIALLNLAKAII